MPADEYPMDLAAETAVPRLATPTVLGVRLARLDVERVCGRPETDDRPAGLNVPRDVLHLAVRQIAEAGEEHHQVRGLQRLEAGDVVALKRIDGSVAAIDGKQHRALEAVAAGQNLPQLRQRLLRAVLLIAADQHGVLPAAGAVESVVHNPLVGGIEASAEQAHKRHD